MMRIETLKQTEFFRPKQDLFSHSPVWWGLKPAFGRENKNSSSFFSAIRQYDEDWNHIRNVCDLIRKGTFQPFASMMRIETAACFCWWSNSALLFSHSPVWWGLKLSAQMHLRQSDRHFSAIRQYDEDWNVRIECWAYSSPTFQPFASMMRIETT